MLHPVQNEMVPIGPPADYSCWYREPVVLCVAAAPPGKFPTHLRCTIMGESDVAVHIYTALGNHDISKKLILAVEETPEPRFWRQ